MRGVLLGYRGTGKSSVGRHLAGLLGVPFIDTARRIEARAGRPVAAIFRNEGEARFREYEREAIVSLPAGDAVIATGGGAVCDAVNVRHLRAGSFCILLTASVEAICRRIAGSGRPPLTALPPEDEVRAMIGKRRQAYRAAADCCVDTTDLAPAEAAATIARILAEGTVRPAEAETGLAALRVTGAAGESLAGIEQLQRRPTRLYGILGFPSRHSKSPGMYNQLFARYGIDGFYAGFESPDPAAVIGALERLDYRGLSVTIPHKTAVIPLLDRLDEDAAAIGAVNTIVRCGGETTGSNTDWLGVRRPVEDLAGGSAVLLGAGGAAAAAAYALVDLDMDVLVLARTKEKAEALATRFHCRAGALHEGERLDADLVVHATPVGMEPDASSLLAAAQLPEGCTVFDLVYTPPETPLLREARRAGCRTIPGTEMFVHQACEQFALFTGIRIPPQEIREMIA